MTQCCCEHHVEDGCGSIPEFERPTYHFGQMLGPSEFESQHRYLADKLEQITRYAIGHGIACGLEVKVEVREPEDCVESDRPEDTWWILIEPGVAIDCRGRLLVVRHPLRYRLVDLLTPSDRAKLQNSPELWLSLCAVEEETCPSRPLSVSGCDPCGPTPMGRRRDAVRLHVAFDAPKDDCDECCTRCSFTCVSLARLVRFDDRQVTAYDGVRRPLGRRFTTIASIGWVHGGTYAPPDGRLPMLKDGLFVRFSRPVHVAHAVEPGVIDITVYQGGRRPAGGAFYPQVKVEPVDATGTLATEFRILYTADRPSDEDRVVVTVRCDFILDDCCRAVDGNHIAGDVEFVKHPADKTEHPYRALRIDCDRSPRPRGLLGNGTEGGTFESWFFIGPPTDTEPIS